MLLHQILTYVNAHHEAILQLLGGAAGLSVLLEGLLIKLKKGRWHIDSKKLSFTMLNVFTGVTALLTPFLTGAPMEHAPAIYATLALVAQTWHRFVISPIYGKWIIPFLEYQADVKARKGTVAQPPLSDPNAAAPAEGFLG